MIDLLEKYRSYCQSQNIPFQLDDHVRPYDQSTLFCPAGMQQFKGDFANPEVKDKTLANIQSCLRLNDYTEIGDGSHLLYFNMMGLFSFRQMTVPEAINFWMIFLQSPEHLGLRIHYVTIHPDKLAEWSQYYQKYQQENPALEILPDPECQWSDGTNQSSYCTEFYINDVEIGNIVNPNGDCIDAGFGLERINSFLNQDCPEFQAEQQRRLNNKATVYLETCEKIFQSGYRPGPNRQGYILRKILRDLVLLHQDDSEPEAWLTELSIETRTLVQAEIQRQAKLIRKYQRLIKKFPDQPDEWWYDTHGIDRKLLGEHSSST